MNVLELKHKVMLDKICRLNKFIESYFIDNKDGEQKYALLKIVQVALEKYNESYEKIINSQNINKSLKYKQLEKVLMEILNDVELKIAKSITKDGECIYERVSKEYKKLDDISDFGLKLKKLEELRDVFNYFKSFFEEEKLDNLYYEAKFKMYFSYTLYRYYNQLDDFNAFKLINDKNELKRLSKYLNNTAINKMQDSERNKKRKVLKLNKKIKRINFVDILKNDNLLKRYIKFLEAEKYFTDEFYRYYSKIPLFDLKEFRVTKEQEKIYKYSIRFKALYAYIKELAPERKFTLEEITSILNRFELYSVGNIYLMCKAQKLDNFMHLMDEIEIDIKKEEFIIKPLCEITDNMIKIEITDNHYFQFEPYRFTKSLYSSLIGKKENEKENEEELPKSFIDGMISGDIFKYEMHISKDKMKEKYEKVISKGLNELMIWNSLVDISVDDTYIVCVNVDEFANGLPVDEKKLKKLRYETKENKPEYKYFIHNRSKYFNAKKNEILDLIQKIKLVDSSNLLLICDEFLGDINIISFNELRKKIPATISNENMNVIMYSVEKELNEIKLDDLENSFIRSMDKLNEINIIFKYIEKPINAIRVNFDILHTKYINKKFEIIVRKIVKDIEKGIEISQEYMKSEIFPYCTERERIEFGNVITESRGMLGTDSEKITYIGSENTYPYSFKFSELHNTIYSLLFEENSKSHQIEIKEINVKHYIEY